MVRALVTGANGLLGCNLVRELKKDGLEVRALVRQSSDARGLEGTDVERVVGDVRNRADLRAAADGCELVFHTAAVFSMWGYSREEMFATATEGARNIVDAAKEAGVRRLVLTSTCAILGGDCEPTPLDESARPDLSDAPEYFQSKALQETTTLERAAEVGLEAIAAMPALILGPHDYKPSASTPAIINYLIAPVTMSYAGGVNIVHAADVARGEILLADRGSPGERYILGGENLDWPSIHRCISDLCGIRRPLFVAGRFSSFIAGAFFELLSLITRRPPLATRELAKQVGLFFWYDHAKAAALGYAPRPLRQTLVEEIAWLLTGPLLSARTRRRLHPAPEVEGAREALDAAG